MKESNKHDEDKTESARYYSLYYVKFYSVYCPFKSILYFTLESTTKCPNC